MKFYNRESEIAELRRIAALSFADHARLTVVTGRRRIGKTSLVLKSFADAPVVYFFVPRKSEAALTAGFVEAASRELGIYVPIEIRNFSSLFRFLMELGQTKCFHLVIDEFQEFLSVNPAIYSEMQDIWDRNKDTTRVNLVVSGSVYSLMNKLFQDKKEPLFGRADNIIRLNPFDTVTLKKILSDYAPGYTNDDLLALYAFTGGVPKYLELFCDNGALSRSKMIRYAARENSPFLEEGKNLLIEEFGKNYGIYFSILSALSCGITTQSNIENAIGTISISGHLRRLVEDYNIIRRVRPILSKPQTQTVRYEIADNFLHFWFGHFDRNQSLIEMRNFNGLEKIIKQQYESWSGHILERYFRQQLAESGRYREIGAWWESRQDNNEIDLVALSLQGEHADVFEIKRQRKNYRQEQLSQKVEHLRQKILSNYTINQGCLTLEDM